MVRSDQAIPLSMENGAMLARRSAIKAPLCDCASPCMNIDGFWYRQYTRDTIGECFTQNQSIDCVTAYDTIRSRRRLFDFHSGHICLHSSCSFFASRAAVLTVFVVVKCAQTVCEVGRVHGRRRKKRTHHLYECRKHSAIGASRHTTHKRFSKALALPNKLLPILWLSLDLFQNSEHRTTYRCCVNKLHHIISMLWFRARPPVQLYKPLSCRSSCEHVPLLLSKKKRKNESPRCVRQNGIAMPREHSFDVMILPHSGYITKSLVRFIFVFCLLLNND